MRPRLPTIDHLSPYLNRIDVNQWYSNHGPLVCELEERLTSRWDNSTHVVTVSNATAGVSLTLQALGCAHGTCCLVPTWTFAATPLSVYAAGLIPYFVDVDVDTQLPNIQQIRSAVKDSDHPVSSLIVVYPFGQPIDHRPWEELAGELGIALVFDAAAAFDAWKPTTAPSVISLHATKILPSGEGGLVISKDRCLIDEIRARQTFGFVGKRESIYQGVNAKMSEYHAAVGLAALDLYPERRAGLYALAKDYKDEINEFLSDQVWIEPTFGESWVSMTLNVRVMSTRNLSEIEHQLEVCGIQTRRWWGLCHAMLAMREAPIASTIQGASLLYGQTLGLPFFLDDDLRLDVKQVIKALLLCI